SAADIALITPIRDGMNLVAKEYIATRTRKDGVLILSEMAGASKEMNEAILINPNNFEQIADSIKFALEMPLEQQISRNHLLQKRLKRYSVEKWAHEFMKSLKATKNIEKVTLSKRLDEQERKTMFEKYNSAKNRLLLLDYDGTLTGFQDNPQNAQPDEKLFSLLDQINNQNQTNMVIISGRDRETLEQWFKTKNYAMITDHGVWAKEKNNSWKPLERLRSDWMEIIRPVLETFADRTPGTFIEEKKYSLAWHYRKADPELAQIRAIELNTVVTSLISNNELTVLNGNKVIEVKNSRVNKGRAAGYLLSEKDYDFILAIGDDWTDEYMFEEIPNWAYS